MGIELSAIILVSGQSIFEEKKKGEKGDYRILFPLHIPVISFPARLAIITLVCSEDFSPRSKD